MTFGKKLQLLRKSQGMSQEQLAGMLAVSRQAVSKWELDAARPDSDNILQISRLFKVTTDYLLNEELEPNPSAAPAMPSGSDDKDAPLTETETAGKASVLSYILIVFAIYMVSFAAGMMTRPRLLPFFAMAATAVSIFTVIFLYQKKH